jgi:hypothetical protein
MVRSEDVTFKTINAAIENVATGDKEQPMDIIEIRKPDGNVHAFPATDRNPESGQRYSEIYATKYQAFKNGDPDPDQVDRLEREIKERQDELNAMRETKPKDDRRVQENLGYGKQPDVKSEQAAAQTADPRATSTQENTGLQPEAPLGPRAAGASAPAADPPRNPRPDRNRDSPKTSRKASVKPR